MVTLKKLVGISLLISSTLSLISCDKLTSKPKIECTNEAGSGLLISKISQEAEKAIKDEKGDVSLSAIRAAINSLNFSTKNIRTSKQDPNSTKVFCETEFVITTPLNVTNDANTALKSANNGKDINLILEDYGFKPSSVAANSYEGTLAYNLQPTDDGKTILAAIDDGSEQVVAGIKDIILWSMAKKDIGKATAANTAQASQVARNDVKNNAMPIAPVTDSLPEPVATSSISTEAKKSYLNCSIQGKIASKKCLLVQQDMMANTPDTIRYFGHDGHYKLLTIMWPDNDVSEYAIIDGSKLINLKKPKSGDYYLQSPVNGEVDLNQSFGIDKNGGEYIRFW